MRLLVNAWWTTRRVGSLTQDTRTQPYSSGDAWMWPDAAAAPSGPAARPSVD
jgi:hypothetical protein